MHEASVDIRCNLDVVVLALLSENFNDVKLFIELALLLSHKFERVGLLNVNI